jgi:rSAM/selenodomain-associated transferase 1
VKTRLCPPLSPAGAARLYRCFLLDTLDRVQAVRGVTPAVAYAPRDARAFFAAARPGMLLVSQGGGDLGARMARVVRYLVARGFAAVVIVGADSPTLPLRHLRAAIRLLGTAATDGVIGPSEDGGYYLIALRAPCPALFAGDTVADLHRLAAELRRRRGPAPRTRRLLGTRAWRAWYLTSRAARTERPTGGARPAAGVRSDRRARRRRMSCR